MAKILWLTSWYPNKSDLYAGDFIKRHAEAVAIYQPLKIIYVGKSLHEDLKERSDSQNLQENILFYPPVFRGNIFISRIRSLYSYFKMHVEFFRILKEQNELPELIHVHVAMKAGIIALYIKWKYEIPYVLTEHWTGYYMQSKDTLFKKSFAERYLTKRILRSANRFLPVSRSLGEQINQHWIRRNFQEIPNVVNTKYFFPGQHPRTGTFRFIHVSALSYQKNPGGIIRAFSELVKDGTDAELVLVGPVSNAIEQLLEKNKLLKDKIKCTGEISYEMVGNELRKSSAFILFSLYENLPCVLLEALCTGIPVIATRVGGISEIIEDDNGILIESKNEVSLFDAMKTMIKDYHKYNQARISANASKLYSYETIGKKIIDVYDSVLADE